MTFKELKNLFKEHQTLRLQINQIKNNDNLSKNEQIKQIQPIETKIKRIEDKIKKYSTLFETKGDILQETLQSNIQNVNIWHDCKIEKHEQDGFYGPSVYYTGSAWISVSFINPENKKTTNINLLTRPVSKDLNNSFTYFLGDYTINILDELLNNNYPKTYSKQIIDALWLIVKNNLLSINKTNHKLNDCKITLLMKKLQILQDEELRQKEINKLTAEINKLNSENTTIDKEPENAKIDNITL